MVSFIRFLNALDAFGQLKRISTPPLTNH